MILNKLHNRKNYRTFLVVYINKYKGTKKLNGDPNFFTYRINSKNTDSIINPLIKKGFVINAVYYKAVGRKSGELHTERLR
jgi:hypothetical protein